MAAGSLRCVYFIDLFLLLPFPQKDQAEGHFLGEEKGWKILLHLWLIQFTLLNLALSLDAQVNAVNRRVFFKPSTNW